MGRMKRPVVCRRVAGLALAGGLCLGAAAGAQGAEADRLDRFRALAATQLSLAQVVDGESATAAYQDVWALLDDEIVESLAGGGVFASIPFLQERLVAFSEVWGAATLRVSRLGEVVIGVFSLGERATSGNSVRVYGRFHGEPALLAALDHGGRPQLHPLPRSGGASQFLVVWEGDRSGYGTRALRIDLLRREREHVRTVWSTAELFPDGLAARRHTVRAQEIRLRYVQPYPGWSPGCEGQTEWEDVYRLTANASGFVRADRRQFNAWHREMRAVAARVFAALADGDARALGDVVPDAALRARLPARLRPEPACDAAEGPAPVTASVAATTEEQRPWSLVFRRVGARWRLTGAAPVLP
jgi:hypothetical protein